MILVPTKMRIVNLNTISYTEALAIQNECLSEVRQGAENTLFLLEHTPVITFGRNGGEEHLHIAPETIRAWGVDVVKSTRGGNITCHFPGQLVAYPIFRIDKRPGGLRQFFYDLEEVAIQTAAFFGVLAHRQEGRPGVWIENRKLCSIGIGVSHWVSYHGFALNVKHDLSLFEQITLCGLPDATATSLERECAQTLSMQEVKDVCTRQFQTIFADSTVATR